MAYHHIDLYGACSPFLQTEENQPFGLDLILRGSEERLIPILMTAATAALDLLPLVLKGDVPGNEIERPMALVILGGLATSPVLNLFLLLRCMRCLAVGRFDEQTACSER